MELSLIISILTLVIVVVVAYLVFSNKKVTLSTYSLVVEVELKDSTKLYQLTYDIEEFDDFYKKDVKYFQQEYRFPECIIILRFNIKIELVEIILQISNNNYKL